MPELLADARLASVGELIRRHRTGPVLDAAAFTALCDRYAPTTPSSCARMVSLTAEILSAHGAVLAELPRVARGQRAGGRRPRRAARQPGLRRASCRRPATSTWSTCRATCRPPAPGSRRCSPSPARDRAGLEIILGCEEAYAELCAAAPPGRLPDFVDDIGWLLEELRVSLFAQPLRTKVPVSEKRVLNAIAQARARLS